MSSNINKAINDKIGPITSVKATSNDTNSTSAPTGTKNNTSMDYKVTEESNVKGLDTNSLKDVSSTIDNLITTEKNKKDIPQ